MKKLIYIELELMQKLVISFWAFIVRSCLQNASISLSIAIVDDKMASKNIYANIWKALIENQEFIASWLGLVILSQRM